MLDRFTYYPCKASAGELMRKLFGALLIALIVCAIGTTMVVAMEDVRVAGSTTVLPLAEGGAEVFNAEQSDYRVTVTGGGTGVGMKNIAEGNSEIAMASREVTDEEREKFGDKFQENLIGYDGIVIAVSREIYDAGVTSLSKEQVEEIYAGEIDNWEELDGPDEEILVIGREQGSGTRDTFNEEIMGDKSAETHSGREHSCWQQCRDKNRSDRERSGHWILGILLCSGRLSRDHQPGWDSTNRRDHQGRKL